MTDPGYYDQSIPPALLVGRARRTTAPARRQSSLLPAGGVLHLTAGPDGYSPAVPAAERPKNLQELTQRVRPGPLATAPWPASASVPIGVRGKRAHWTGTEWKGGASPGYQLEQQPAEPIEEGAVLEGQSEAVVIAQDGQQVSGVLEPPAPWSVPADTSQAAGGDVSPTAGDDASSLTAGTTVFPGDEMPGDLSR